MVSREFVLVTGGGSVFNAAHEVTPIVFGFCFQRLIGPGGRG